MSIPSMLRRGTLFCITGIDGAGKTTVAKEVTSELRSQGVAVHYTWAMHHPFLLVPFLALARLSLLNDSENDYSARTQQKTTATNTHPFLSKLYIGVLLTDYTIQLIGKVWIPLMLGRTVICDRYLFDTAVIQLSVDFDLTIEEVKSVIDALLVLHPNPDEAFYITVPPEVSMQRKDDIPDQAYLTERKRYYDAIVDEYGFVVLDGTSPVNATVSQILESSQ